MFDDTDLYGMREPEIPDFMREVPPMRPYEPPPWANNTAGLYRIAAFAAGGLTLATGYLALYYWSRKDRIRLTISGVLCAGLAVATVILAIGSIAENNEW